MNRFIKKLAILYNEETSSTGSAIYDDKPDEYAVEVLTWLFSKPLINRLSKKDREILNNIYSEAVRDIEHHQNKVNLQFDDLLLRYYERENKEYQNYQIAQLKELFNTLYNNKLSKEDMEDIQYIKNLFKAFYT